MLQAMHIRGFTVFAGILLLTPIVRDWLPNYFDTTLTTALAVLLLVLPINGFSLLCYLKMPQRQQHYQRTRKHDDLWLILMGKGTLWAILLVLLILYPEFAQRTLDLNHPLALSIVLSMLLVGLALGVKIARNMSKSHIETGLVPVGALGIMLALLTMGMFPNMLLQMALLGFLGVMAGLFIDPLHALVRYHVPHAEMPQARYLHNWLQSLIMLSFVSITTLFAAIGLPEKLLFPLLTGVVIAGALYTLTHLPQSLLRFIISRLFHARYRLKVVGFENLPASGGLLLLGNHISFVDWALVQMACPRQLHFVIERGYYERWYLKWVLDRFNVVPIRSAGSANALNKVNELLAAGEAVCLFPEGALSRTGQLGEFKHGYEKAIRETDAQIIPFYLHGLWGSRFSRSSGFLRQSRQSGFKRDIVVAFGEGLAADTDAALVKQRVFELSITSWETYAQTLDPIPVNWLRSAKRLGFRLAAADVQGEPLSHHRFMTAVLRFSTLIEARNPEQNVGLLLPTSAGGAIANMAVMCLGKTVVNINYTASEAAIKSAIQQAELRRLFTSRRFIDKLKERGINIPAMLPGTPLIYLEDLKETIPKQQLLATLLMVILLPTRLLQWLYISPIKMDDTAAILFSSGSEGAPKGVELTHGNLAANARQVADVLNTLENDVLMSTLPSFHAFGLLTSNLMPLSEGIPIVCHPDPMDSVNIAKGVARYEATLLFGTSTFLRLYARNPRVHPLMFQSLRYVVSGAEKLTPDVRKLFLERFGKQIQEGYGTTETSPVAAVNIPDQIDTRFWKVQTATREGSVGLPLPGTSFRIVDPDTLQTLPTGEDGLILIGGPQVMKGYLNNPEKTTQVISVLDGQRWYHTGDKGHVDEDGFLTIVDRYSRFAKLGGEMVSLGAIEEQIRLLLEEPELEMVAMNLPDEKKGEKVILLLADEREPQAIKRSLRELGMNPLMLPAEIHRIEAVPKLGSGKTDFARSRQLAEQLSA